MATRDETRRKKRFRENETNGPERASTSAGLAKSWDLTGGNSAKKAGEHAPLGGEAGERTLFFRKLTTCPGDTVNGSSGGKKIFGLRLQPPKSAWATIQRDSVTTSGTKGGEEKFFGRTEEKAS